VDPSLDVNDVIYVHSNGAKVDRTVIIDQLEIPLEVEGQLSVQTRVVRVVSQNEIVGVGV